MRSTWAEANVLQATGMVARLVLMRLTGVAILGVCLSLINPSRTWAQQGVEGVVVDAVTESPIDGAGILLVDSSGVVHGTTVTDSGGHFALRAPSAGSYLLDVQRIGFIAARSLALQIPQNVTVSVRISLTPSAVMLEAITVFGEAPPRLTPELEEFLARRRMRIGYSFAREDFQRLHAEHPVELLREVPGFVTVSPRAGYRWYALNFRRCPPSIFIDGRPSRLPTTELLENMSLQGVYGVEVFRTWSGTPAQYASRCGSIVIWTRPPES